LIASTEMAARVRALSREQLSLLVLGLSAARREVVAAPPPPSAPLAHDAPVDELSDEQIQQLLGQMLAADPEAAALLADAPAVAERPDVNALSDDEVTALLAAMLANGGGA
jgi:hypothetical protein